MSVFLTALLIGNTYGCQVPSGEVATSNSFSQIEKTLSVAVCDEFSHQYGVDAFIVKSKRGDLGGEDCWSSNYDISFGEIEAGRVKLNINCKSGYVSFNLELNVTSDVWVARRNIKKHTKIRSKDVKNKRLNVSRFIYSAPIIKVGDVRGLYSLKPIREGQILTEKILVSPPLIEKGDVVAITFKENGISIVSKGTAVSVGWLIGDPIYIKPSHTSEVLKMIVVDRKGVQVEY